MFRYSLLFVVVLLADLGVGTGSSAAQTEGAPALTVAVAAPIQREWPETVPASGWLRPWQEAVIAAETSGLRIVDVAADVGSVVKKGQPLARLSQDTVLAEIRQAEATAETARANLAKAKAEAARARQLGKTGAMAEQTVFERLTTEQTAQASLTSAEAALDLAKIKLEQSTIRAVDDGLITSNTALLGSVVSPGTELFRMIRQQRVEWQAEVSARYLPRIFEGLPVVITGIGERPVEGTVRLVGPTIGTGTGRAIVYVSLPENRQPRIGLYVTGSIQLATTPALTVPETAITFRDGLSYVFVTEGNSRVQRVHVETGRRKDGEVEILSGLDASSKIVTAGGAFLSANVLVEIAGTVQ